MLLFKRGAREQPSPLSEPQFTVAGIALKGQADLISKMVPLEVLVSQKKDKK